MIDTILCESKGSMNALALMNAGITEELEFINLEGAVEGDIYLGKITKKVELANQKTGYFVDIADTKEGFINADEFGLKDLTLSEGQSIVVQVSQEARAEKGARLVRALQFVGEHIVYCPFRMTVEASLRIEDKNSLDEYKEKVLENMTGQEGWILRTSCLDVPFEKIAEEMKELRAIYENIRIKARNASAPSLLLAKDNPLFEAINRNKETLQKVILNSRNLEAKLQSRFGKTFSCEIDAEPFEKYGIEEVLSDALQKTVKLPSGGRIIIEETRACVAIDVDSGEDKGHGALPRLNSEAAYEIAHQIRLRNLAGKIIIDFAGSSEYKFMKPVLEILENEMSKDSSKGRVLGLSRAGNVEIVRVRRRPSLSDLFTEPCTTCQGTGRVAK